MKKKIKTSAGELFHWALSRDLSRNLRIVLMYHSVRDRIPEGLHDPALVVTADTLDMHLRELKQYFEIVPLERIVETPGTQRRLCAVTFDDGWRDNYEQAFPVLRKHAVPATIFLPIEEIGSGKGFWFQNLWDLASRTGANGGARGFLRYFSAHAPAWRADGMGADRIADLAGRLKYLPADRIDEIVLQAYRELGVVRQGTGHAISWEQAREMSGQGISFGSHGLHHYILPGLQRSAKRSEIADSLRYMRQAGVCVSPFFSYPNGDWDDESRSFVEEAGYQGGVTTKLGCNGPLTDRRLLKRIALHEEISSTPALFWFRIFQAVLVESAA